MAMMEHYEKTTVTKNYVEPDNEVVKCSQHGRLHGFVHFAKKQLKSNRAVTISGIGGGIGKAVSTAELLKKEMQLHQTNTVSFVTMTELWEPKENKVCKQLPS
eukprot:sb/3478172/